MPLLGLLEQNTSWLMHDSNLFLTVVEPGKVKMKALRAQVSGEGHFLVHR